jgi:ATP-dependent RNA helicase DeaD
MDTLMQADVSHGDYETYMPDLVEKFAHVSKEEVLQRVAALEFDHFLKYYENAEDLNRSDFKEKRGRDNIKSDFNSSNTRERSSFNSGRNSGYTRLFINLGTKDGFYKASFLQFILDESNLKKEVLGKIDMRDMNSWIEIDSAEAGRMIKSIDGKRYNNRTIRMNEADGGFKRPNDEGNAGGEGRERKRTYAPKERRSFR